MRGVTTEVATSSVRRRNKFRAWRNGVGYSKPPTKVIGGLNASPQEFPYQVSLQKRGFHFCGGSIITHSHILTAAHCLYTPDEYEPLRPEAIEVVTAVTDTRHHIPGYVHGVVAWDHPPEYTPKGTLQTRMFFNEWRLPINLTSAYTLPGESVTATGWGVAKWQGNKSKGVRLLQKLEMFIVDLEECTKLHQPVEVNEGNICAIGRTGTAVCKGDSGGPLVHDGELVGVVSWGVPCAQGLPDVFTSVAYYLPWIESVL
ncbi:chymotrypsin-2 [Diachasma alloeum]|uniref:chymotrypsin-2 n=1 Tax=Diachasma alloeum TaxID=454923 RepID=UPI000738500F|nr:chymotrypsin-2 [Diachasma alloeum]